jgi:hypothetical protein
MFPWLWLYAPQICWPLGGAVTEAISTEAFFRGIKPGARARRAIEVIPLAGP